MHSYNRKVLMKHHRFLFAVGLSLLIAGPAFAQGDYDRSPARPGAKITVDSWSPREGQVGTEVTIRGRGFSPRMKVIFGGRKVKVTWPDRDTVTFRVPRNYRDGTIVLRTPRGRYGKEVVVGTFSVIEPAQIARFAPQSGMPGTRVEIIGSGFQQSDQVYIGRIPLRVERLKPRRIVAVIPRNAPSDYLYVVGADGNRVRTTNRFDVLAPIPEIDAIEPASGFPGTVVRITGRSFGRRAEVFYGKKPIAVSGRGKGWIDVRIPANAKKGRWIFVRGRNGEARSPQKFVLEYPPLVSRISPTSGSIGQRVDIYGSHFQPGDRVSFAGVWANVAQLRNNQITVRVPQGAKSGPIVVRRGKNLQGVSSQEFQVLYGPIIRSFSPAQGGPGSQVTIVGEYFDRRAQVFYGNKRLRILNWQSNDAMVVQVPRNARNGKRFRVRTRTGEAVTDRKFQLLVAPALTDVNPRKGFPGVRIALRSPDFAAVESIYLGNVELPIRDQNPGRWVVEIPLGARSGTISLYAYGKKWPSNFQFQVTTGPMFESFSPKSSRPGNDVTIRGRFFNAQTRVYLDRTELPVLRWSDREMVVRLPRTLRPGAWRVRIRRGRDEIRSPGKLQILPGTSITKTSAAWVYEGSDFTIRGQYFDPNAKVYWGDVELQVTRFGPRGRSVQVIAPRGQNGKRYLWLEDANGRYRSPQKFEVRPVDTRDHRGKRGRKTY